MQSFISHIPSAFANYNPFETTVQGIHPNQTSTYTATYTATSVDILNGISFTLVTTIKPMITVMPTASLSTPAATLQTSQMETASSSDVGSLATTSPASLQHSHGHGHNGLSKYHSKYKYK